VKRKILLILFFIGLVAMLSAQEGNRRERTPGRTSARETVTVSGILVVANGMPAIKSGDDTYLISGMSRLIGFVDGLREGAYVTIEGTAAALPGRNNTKYLIGSKLTVGVKSYDLSPSTGMMGMGMMWMRNFNPGEPPSLPDAPGTPIRPRTPQRR